MTTPSLGQRVTVSFRTDGNCKRIGTSQTQYTIEAVYTDKDKHGNPNVKLNNGDVFYIQMTDRGWIAVS